MNTYKISAVLRIVILSTVVVLGGYSQAVPGPVEAAYGTVPGQREITPQNEVVFVPEAGFSPGIFAVPLNVNKAIALDTEGTGSSICFRIDEKSFELKGYVNYKFQCDRSLGNGDLRPDLVFVASTDLLPKLGEKLEWSRFEGSPLSLSNGEKLKDLHTYTAVASPKLLKGSVLVSTAWFSGLYPPAKERDELRDDLMAFGHYNLLDRALFIGQSATQPGTFLYKASNPFEVSEGLEWALLPEDASEKTMAQISAIYEIPKGYMLRVTQTHDHEGFGSDDSTYLYVYDGSWRLFATAERTRTY